MNEPEPNNPEPIGGGSGDDRVNGTCSAYARGIRIA